MLVSTNDLMDMAGLLARSGVVDMFTQPFSVEYLEGFEEEATRALGMLQERLSGMPVEDRAGYLERLIDTHIDIRAASISD